MSDEARRSDVVAFAQEMFRLQVGSQSGAWVVTTEEQRAAAHEGYRRMAREALSAAEAFFIEARDKMKGET